ncbi:MAG: cytochrome b/b6 domain-containing protein [Actinomycetota bacterium]
MTTKTTGTGTRRTPAGRLSPLVERYNRRTRWFHAAVYIVTTILLATGWWLLSGREGTPTPAAGALGVGDVTLHEWAGWALLALGALGATRGARAARTLIRASLSFARGDLRWFPAWPRAAVTGRFAAHDGAFDPGQRVANLVMVGGLAALAASGVGLVLVSGGPAFALLLRVHKAATYIVTPVIVGHVVVAAGLLPGYRGVWRSMHGRGRLEVQVARRLWPRWTERRLEDLGRGGTAHASAPSRPPGEGPGGSGQGSAPSRPPGSDAS